MEKFRKNNFMEVRKNDHPIRIRVNDIKVIELPGYSIGIGDRYLKGGSMVCYTPELSLEDLKELRRVIRKAIRDESK